jgi:hypothetical protein
MKNINLLKSLMISNGLMLRLHGPSQLMKGIEESIEQRMIKADELKAAEAAVAALDRRLTAALGLATPGTPHPPPAHHHHHDDGPKGHAPEHQQHGASSSPGNASIDTTTATTSATVISNSSTPGAPSSSASALKEADLAKAASTEASGSTTTAVDTALPGQLATTAEANGTDPHKHHHARDKIMIS